MKTKNFFTVLICLQLVSFGTIVAQGFEHPGVLWRESDFARMREKVAEKAEPWYTAWNNLLNTREASSDWIPRPAETIIRGGVGDNVGLLYRDVAAAYENALIYKISGDAAHGAKAVEILNAWSSVHKVLTGNADRYLASGLFGYQFANVAEMMRGYSGFEFKRFTNYMRDVFYKPLVERFLFSNEYGDDHNDACITNYRANWDICNMNAAIAYCILTEDKEGFDRVIDYYKTSESNGGANQMINNIHSDIWGQWEESGRDQGHCMEGMCLFGFFCEMAWNQGADVYSYDNYRFRKGAEYVCRYNIMTTDSLGSIVGKYNDLPYNVKADCTRTEYVLSTLVRGASSTAYELLYTHYANRLHQEDKILSITEKLAQAPSLIGASLDIHPSTFDVPGFGALTYRTDSGYYIPNWTYMDISTRSITKLPHYGHTTLEDSTFTVIGSGAGVKETADQCHFAFQRLIDDGSIVTKLSSFDDIDSTFQCGLMMRENFEQNSINVFLSLSSGQGAVFSSRDSIGTTTNTIASNASFNNAPCWLKISRTDDTFTAYVSTNGTTWTEIGRKYIEMTPNVYVGFAVSSNAASSVCTATFDKTEVTQGAMRPIIKMTSPNCNVNFVTPANVTISGSVYDIDGSIDKTELYINDELITTFETEDFSHKLTGVEEGDYMVRIKSYDNEGNTRCDTINYSVSPITTELPWYKFDEPGYSSTALDASGNNMNAINYGAMPDTGRINNCIYLDGGIDYIKLPVGFVEKLSDFTITTWVNPTELTAWDKIFSFGSGTDNYMALSSANTLNRMRFSILADGIEEYVESALMLNVAKWNFVTVTMESTKVCIYLNGTLVGVKYSQNLKPYDLIETTKNHIGCSQTLGVENFKGKIDEFKFYNYGMTADQVKTEMGYTALKDLQGASKLIYPNPASTEIHIKDAQGGALNIYDSLGRLAIQQTINSSNETVNVSALKSGIYFVKIINSNSLESLQNEILIIK